MNQRLDSMLNMFQAIENIELKEKRQRTVAGRPKDEVLLRRWRQRESASRRLRREDFRRRTDETQECWASSDCRNSTDLTRYCPIRPNRVLPERLKREKIPKTLKERDRRRTSDRTKLNNRSTGDRSRHRH